MASENDERNGHGDSWHDDGWQFRRATSYIHVLSSTARLNIAILTPIGVSFSILTHTKPSYTNTENVMKVP